ncbi:hypothetical protein PV328_012166, partial [Microctonus aethiopoides]
VVEDLGPLWTTSCFPFEDLLGKMVDYVHGTRYVGLQIHTKFDELVNKKKCVELLPISWLFDDDSRCYYPSKRDYGKIEEWVKNLQVPKKNWSSYPVTIIAKAIVNSSDSESQQLIDSEPLLLDSAGVSDALFQTKPLTRTESNALGTIFENDTDSIP